MRKLSEIGVAAALVFVCAQAVAGPITNKDVLSLLEAGMPEDVVLEAIFTGDAKFDTSAAALIKLKNKGATPTILKAVLSPKIRHDGAAVADARPAARGAAEPAKKASGNAYNPEEVMLVLDGKATSMQYVVAGSRTAARALGFGGVATYAVVNGGAAVRRVPKSGLEFLVSVPKNAQAPNYVSLAQLEVNDGQSRDVMVGGGFLSYSTGIDKDRLAKLTIEKLDDQTRATDGFILYRVKPSQDLAAGEYALVLYTGEVRTAGFFAQATNSYFDFGVDN
jgi:hypothetical protein